MQTEVSEKNPTLKFLQGNMRSNAYGHAMVASDLQWKIFHTWPSLMILNPWQLQQILLPARVKKHTAKTPPIFVPAHSFYLNKNYKLHTSLWQAHFFFSFQNLKISRELHINQMKVDHSSWNWQWQVARMKAKMDCAFMTLQARLGCAWPFWWVKRWKVRLFPTINSNSDSWLTTPFSFHTAKAVWERVFCCFYCYVRTSTNEVANNSTGMCMIYVFHKRSWVLHCFVDLNVNLHPNLAFNLSYHGDLIQWMFLRMVHANWT